MAVEHKKIKEIIEHQVVQITDGIREYTKNQKQLWQQVPSLALEADGRTGYSDSYSRAYSFGYWPLEASIQNGQYRICIDLVTGELLDIIRSSDEGDIIHADNTLILQLVNALDELNAEMLVQNLQDLAQRPYGSAYSEEEQERWKEDIRAKTGLQKYYSQEQRRPSAQIYNFHPHGTPGSKPPAFFK